MTPDPRMLPVYQGSIYSLLQRSVIRSPQACFVIAVTSAHSRSGVTYLSKLLVDLLNQEVPKSATLVSSRTLFGSPESRPDHEDAFSLWVRNQMALSIQNPKRVNLEFRDGYIRHLRERFSYVILDCAPVSESSEVLGLAGLVDGIVSIVEANRTTKAQIASLERSVDQSGGKLLGHVLNKGTMPLPAWLDSKLERMGI